MDNNGLSKIDSDIIKKLSVNENRTVCYGDGSGVMVQQRWFLDALVHSQFLPLEHLRCKVNNETIRVPYL